MNNKTRVVSVYVEGQPERLIARVTVIHRYPEIDKVSGDSPMQAGSPGSRLLDPFTVKITDAGGNNVRGQKVTFLARKVTGNTQSAIKGSFSAHPDFPVTGDIPAGDPKTTIADISSDSNAKATVTTDLHGTAKVYLILGSSAGKHTVTAQFSYHRYCNRNRGIQS